MNNMSILESNLPIYEKMVLIVLNELAITHEEVFPSYETIAQLCSMSIRKAIYVVKNLCSMGLIDKYKQTKLIGEHEVQTSNIYMLNAQDAPLEDKPVAQDAPYKSSDLHALRAEEEEIHTSSIDDIPYLPFENEIKRHGITSHLRKCILNCLSVQDSGTGDIWFYSREAISNALDKAIRRLRNGVLFNPPAWIATAIRNEQFRLDQVAAAERERAVINERVKERGQQSYVI